LSKASATISPATQPARIRFPIRLKITLPFLIMAIALALGASYLVTKIVFDTVDERYTNQLIESGKLAAEWMVSEEDRLLETLRLLAYSQGVPEALGAADAESLRNLTFGVTVNNQEESVEFLDRSGNILLAMRHRQGGLLEEYLFVKNGDQSFMKEDFIQKIMNLNADQKGDKFSGIVQADWGDYFYVAGPVFDAGGQLLGVILVGKTIPSLARQMREQTLAQVTLYNTEGTPIASTFPSAQDLPSERASSILAVQDISSFRRSLDSRRDVTALNLNYEEILGPWNARRSTNLGIIGTSLAKNFLVSASQVTRLQIMLLIGLTFFLVILLGLNVANVITRPLIGLSKAARQVTQGNLKVRVPVAGNDEVAVLADSFNQMVNSLDTSKKDLLKAYDSALEGWSLALEMRDKETEGHTKRVMNMTLRLAQFMGIHDAEQLLFIRRGALLHDIGKMAVSDAILHKDGPLTPAERDIIRKHPESAYQMLSQIEFLQPAIDIPYCHHEWWNGGGYPRGLKGDDIPLSARIFTVVDVWDALMSHRPYRNALPSSEVITTIRAGSGTQFDPRVVDAFLKMLEEQPDHGFTE
jgi:putative nucleotidyltransferase with HDIG domain